MANQIKTQNTVPTTSGIETDLLSSAVLARYFTAREHEVYFNSLRSVDDKRNFYEKLEPALSNLLAYIGDETSLELLDTFVFRNRKKLKNVNHGLQVLDYLKKTNPRGVQLLELSGTVTFESLRAAYKKAALKHHPDRGGNTEDMQTVNKAFAEFHEVLSQWREPSTSSGPTENLEEGLYAYWYLEINSSIEYLHWTGWVLLGTQTDSWAVDYAYTTFKNLYDHGFMSSYLVKQTSFLVFIPETLRRLIERLCAAKLFNQGKFIYKCSSELVEKSGDLDDHLRMYFDFTHLEDVLSGDEKVKVIIKHPLHAENLYRLKVIDEKKYKNAMSRYETRHADKKTIEGKLANFQKSRGFIPLLFDHGFKCEPGVKKLVPLPDWGSERINHLSDDQRAEYFRIFGLTGTRDEIENYLTIRLTSYLCTLLQNFDPSEAEKIEDECVFLRTQFPERGEALDVIVEVSKHLRELDSITRNQKLTLLRKLDTSEKRELGLGFTLNFDNIQHDPKIRAEPTQQYLDVVRASLERLRLVVKTGSTYSPHEEEREKSAWERDLLLIRKIDKTPVARKAHDRLFDHRNKPEKVVEAVKPYIEQLLAAGKEMSSMNTGQLQLGYWIDGISAAFLKLKKWDEARYWLELYFGLDVRYQDRLSRGEKEKMLKRLKRCKIL